MSPRPTSAFRSAALAWQATVTEASTAAAAARITASMTSLALTSQQVMWLRMSRLARDGASPANQRELQRMVSEKVEAVTESALGLQRSAPGLVALMPRALTGAAAAGRLAARSTQVADRALRPFARRIDANATRLSKS